MIIYDIKCDQGHIFEGWFADRLAWIEQNAKGLVSCPVCASAKVEVIPSAPAVVGKGHREAQRSNEMQPMPQEALRQLSDFVQSHFEDVGDQFADVALKIHSGEEEKRNIRGTTTPAEEDHLRSEGISFIKIPFPKMDS